MDGYPVDVEVAVSPGLPSFTVVGLPDASIQEARERVRAAIVAAGEEWPMQRVTVNLSPAHLQKAGSGFDLAIAIALLAARARIAPERLERVSILGELSLDGGVRPIRGVLPAAMSAARAGARTMLVPAPNAAEAALVRDLDVVPLDHLARAVRMLRGEVTIDPARRAEDDGDPDGDLDISDVRGQAETKGALEVAAAGGHNVMLIGPPGAGKTMLARRLPGILPPLSEDEAFEVTRVYSVAGLVPDGGGLIRRRPFRAPHHTASTTGVIGGGSGIPHLGEVSLAHRGILFLDEYGEFRNEVLQSLRQPLEDGNVTIVRARWAVTYPARFMLVAGSNPCPCGFAGDDLKECVCSPVRLAGYRERLTGPVMDRIDIHVKVPRLRKEELFAAPRGEPSDVTRARVIGAREAQAARWARAPFSCNADIPPRGIEDAALLDPIARGAVENAVERHTFSARAAHRLIRVARTVADLAGSECTALDHVERAIDLRVSEVDAG
jgi:magnesium chelatase family protein